MGGMGMGMGGMGMGFGGYGMGMGMMGMSGMAQDGFLMQSLRMMESAGFLVSSLAQMARTMEMNAEGFYRLFSSLFAVINRFKAWIVKGFKLCKKYTVKLINLILVLLKLKKRAELSEDDDTEFEGLSKEEIELIKLKRKARMLDIIFKVGIGLTGLLFITANLYNPNMATKAPVDASMESAFNKLIN